MNLIKLLMINLFLLFISVNSFSNDNVLKYLENNPNYSYFYKLIKKAKYEKLFLEETKFKKVLYIPTNKAFDNLPIKLKNYIWDVNDSTAAKKVIQTHLFAGSIKKAFKDPSKKVVIIERVEINNERVKIYSNQDLFVKDMVQKESKILKDNFEIIPVRCVMYLQPSFDDNRLNDKEKRESFITSCCMLTSDEVNNFIKNDLI